MKTSEVYDLVCFMNKKKIKFPIGTQIIMQSKSNKDYELTLEFGDFDGTAEWKLAIDPTPHDEYTMLGWMEYRWEIETHPAYGVSDWAMEKESREEIWTALRECRKKAMASWDQALFLAGSCDLYVFEYPEEDEND